MTRIASQLLQWAGSIERRERTGENSMQTKPSVLHPQQRLYNASGSLHLVPNLAPANRFSGP